MIDAKELAMRPKKPKLKNGKDKTLFHGKMHGLNNDDHAQYLTTDRGDKRYYTKKEIDIFIGGLPVDFYTKEVVDNLLVATKKSLTTLLESKADRDHIHETEYDVGHLHDLIRTKADEDHVHSEIYSKNELRNGMLDDRYYTEQEIEILLDKIREALDNKSQVGHKHINYYTKEALDSGQLDSLYFTRKELNLILDTKASIDHEHEDLITADALLDGTLDGRYYTKDGLNQHLSTITYNIEKFVETHEHKSYCSKSELTKGFLDKRYYPKTEVNQLISDTLADVGSKNHLHREYLETKEFRKYINQINASFDNLAKYTHDHPEIFNALKDLYYTEVEVEERLKKLKESLINIIDNIIEEGLIVKESVENKANSEHEHRHKDMSGLVEDDHPQYLLASGDRELIDDWDIGQGKMIKAGCLKARSDDGLELLNALN